MTTAAAGRRLTKQALARLRTRDLGVSYSRFSTDRQGSTAEQIGINEDIADDEGIEIPPDGYFMDEGVSRSVADRPDLLRMFTHLENHPEIAFIITNELERLTSGIAQRHDVAVMCQRLHITIVTEDMGRIDPFDEQKMHEADQRSVTSKGEVIKVGRRTRRNLKKKVEGGRMAFRPPFGVRMKPLVLDDGTVLPSGTPLLGSDGKKVRSGEVELHPTEHPWLVQIFDWAFEGKASDWIAGELTKKNVPTKNGRQMWRGNTINGILDNPFYKGEWVWGRTRTVKPEAGKKYLEVREEDDPGRLVMASPLGAIIPVEKWDAIHKMREERRNTRRRTRRTHPKQVFDDMVWCGRCGYRMYGRNDRPKEPGMRWRYYCQSDRPGVAQKEGWGAPCERSHSISLRKMLAAMAQTGTGAGSTFRVRSSGTTGLDADARRRLIEGKIEAADAAYDRATDLAIEGLLSKAKLVEKKDARDEAIRVAQAELEALTMTGAAPLVETLSDQTAAAWRDVSTMLADETTPASLGVQALRNLGVVRIEVNNPLVTFYVNQ